MVIADVQLIMAISMFVLGMCSCIGGLWTILSRRYREALRNVSAHSAQVSSKAIGDTALAPLVDSISGLIRALDQLVRTSVGIGVFLCLVGTALCITGFWMLNNM